jgi:hypothetical protein
VPSNKQIFNLGICELNMFDQVEIRTADSPPITRGFLIFVFSIVWGFVSVTAVAVLENRMYALAIAASGLPVWMYLLRRQGRIERFLKAQRSMYVQTQKEFCCQECRFEIERPLKHQDKHGQPILYYCPNCRLLWFTGLIDKST